MKTFYITTTLPYVNAEPHIGFAMELIQADVIARYHAQLGDEVVFNTGTDEHGVKIYSKAIEQGKDPQDYVDEYAEKFKNLVKVLNLSSTNFIRTTDDYHKKSAQEFWKRCLANSDIYKASYKIKYCTGCELEKTDSELADGKCGLHPNLQIEEREEENYFFKFSKFQKSLLKFYEDNPTFVLPDFRFNEIKRFVEGGLNDFSISRLKSKMPWGIEVPGDPEQVVYVWFDALINYVSTLGWPFDPAQGKPDMFSDFWPGTQVAGKDNLRQQSAIWQAMLMSAGLPNSKQILIHGFINIDGQKMSKSLGNVTNPFPLVEKYGVDVLRYFLLREIPSTEDGDFSEEKLVARYNGDLANGLGNLVARVATLLSNNFNEGFEFDEKLVDSETNQAIQDFITKYKVSIENFKLHEVLIAVWELIARADKYVNDNKPWALAKKDTEKFKIVMTNLVEMIYHITKTLAPFMPETSGKISDVFDFKKEEAGLEGRRLKVRKGGVLFPRIEQ
ncbi:MAG: methionine--tRNA ligase [Candidatus Yanofskybacteria bacterium RIFCSPHIGHO2_01_FULL_41_21]|uniref:Methionine--tRNA ligase n=2 Tax=Candidatus Yanofskyibacteriota TaxID=1752733 RepID=A0A1F8EB36_9BACT|nr:MAG: methionine--tRNA ligase [Candidatus Yanofskybacteria bacterium RIFCSPHIGHO2_01_FULL_41_21]